LRGEGDRGSERGREMRILGMRFFISSSLERKGMGFHEAFSPKKGMKFYPFSRRVLGYSTVQIFCLHTEYFIAIEYNYYYYHYY